MYKNFFKRLIDVWLSIFAVLILFPFILILIVILFLTNAGTPFFFQLRPGKGGKPFKLIKFKTMNDTKDKEGNLLPDAGRITHLGRIIRNTSLDEIPQLLNVIKGDMSLVGPRPLLTEYMPLYNANQKKRHDVRPGITGWAQVNGRNLINWGQKFEYDVWYTSHLTFWLDVKIVWMTFAKVFKREGISHKGHVTMHKFKGDNI
ncbi:sugar transferase [Mucilaginibacter gotjawali]|uniref:Undecaprenyl phosphate N,N'-diacetylbacillosamine 1-phosphate transferase n=2 Tax=Mucilaginibacter gotjawali TaxID=1550579 RepID=A0A0X8X2D4_9SPHI|nr:sugar transferase [Mucilaginibacter gotjawali]BAU54350.1 Undecaprenyl phosphate N,N'-diacetylbacillosamine 1-phosphate transferase [Mucilaginibacter gotjawali]